MATRRAASNGAPVTINRKPAIVTTKIARHRFFIDSLRLILHTTVRADHTQTAWAISVPRHFIIKDAYENYHKNTPKRDVSRLRKCTPVVRIPSLGTVRQSGRRVPSMNTRRMNSEARVDDNHRLSARKAPVASRRGAEIGVVICQESGARAVRNRGRADLVAQALRRVLRNFCCRS